MQAGRWLVVISMMLAAWACGGKDDSGTSGSAVMAAAGAGSVATCGGLLCKSFEGPGLTAPLEACCADQIERKCGVKIGDSCRQPPQETSHPTCASVDMSGFGLVLFGCCVDHKCGLVDTFSGGNMCRDIETLTASAMMSGRGGFFTLPPAMACD